MPRLTLTDHAIERFRERIAPGFPFFRARREMYALMTNARRTHARTLDGQEIWRTGTNDEVLFIIKNDPSNKNHRVIVTVMHMDDARSELRAAGEIPPEQDDDKTGE